MSQPKPEPLKQHPLTSVPYSAQADIMDVTIRRADRTDDAARDSYVRAHQRGSFFHLSTWGRVVEKVMKHRRVDLVALQGPDIVGMMPVSICRGLRGRSLISVPYGVYGGAIGDSPGIELSLFRMAEQHAQDLRARRLEVRTRLDPGLPLSDELVASELYATFVKQLPESVDEVLAGMPKKSRADARKARKTHGLELLEGREFLPELVELFHRNKRQLGSPGLPLSWFEELLADFGEQITVHVVRKGDETLCAVMSFLYEDQVLAYYSGSAEDVDRNYKASAFMYMALQEWSVENGYRVFDFGRSRKDSGAFDFKRRQGFEPADLQYRYRLLKDKGLPSLTPSNPKTKGLRDTWSKLPIWLTTMLSTPASRLLP
ncbi:MAG: FemAB-related protein (PEP-CTERM system-associated) [Planctomycetota bacterium]|jgi:FemAB-related protein (PEP-CTERM system-associated)